MMLVTYVNVFNIKNDDSSHVLPNYKLFILKCYCNNNVKIEHYFWIFKDS